MSWQYNNEGYKSIVVKVNGSIIATPEIMYFPLLMDDGKQRLINNNFAGATYSYTGNSNSTPERLSVVMSYLTTCGDFDFFNFLSLISVGQTIEIYNANFGETFKLIFRKTGPYICTMSVKNGSVTKNDVFSISLQHTSYTYVYGPVAGFGFAFDYDNSYACPVYVTVGVYDDGYGIIYGSYVNNTYAIQPADYNIISSVALVIFSDRATPPTPSYNPYADGGFSDESGTPSGDYDDTSDVISVPSIPSFNLGITSLINVWVPSTGDINNLASYLWSNFDLTDPTKTLSKMFTDPLSYILSLHMLPFTVGSSTAITVTLAGLATTVSMPPATEQFHDIDCGSVTISEYWGNYLDYTYTKIVLCLPFCGQVDLDPDEVMGKTIKVKYRVDIITGAFVCFVYIDGDKVLGQYAGNCAAQIPISAADFSRLNAAVLGVAGAAASAFGSAALGGHGGMLNGASGGLISSIAANSQNAKVRAQHSGGLTGAPGFMGIQKPYLIIHRPRQSVPEDYEQFKGYPSNVTMQLSSCTGFTSVREIKLNGLPFTDGELSELKSILEGGVIL